MSDWKNWELRMLKGNKSATALAEAMDHSIGAIKRKRYELTGRYVVDADLEEKPVQIPCGANMTEEEKIERIVNLAEALGVKIGG